MVLTLRPYPSIANLLFLFQTKIRFEPIAVLFLNQLKQKHIISMRVLLGLSEITISRLCKIQATKRKIEHMPNITVIVEKHDHFLYWFNTEVLPFFLQMHFIFLHYLHMSNHYCPYMPQSPQEIPHHQCSACSVSFFPRCFLLMTKEGEEVIDLELREYLLWN